MKIENKSIYHQHNEIDGNIQKDIEEKKYRRRKRSIMIILGAIMILSLLNMFSIGYYKEDQISLRKYAILMGGAIASSWVIPYHLSYKEYRKKYMKILLIVGCLALLLLVMFGPPSIVPNIKGAKGWLKIKGFTLQPSEILKIPFIILLANVLAKGEEKKLPINKIICNSLIIFIGFAIFICHQNDLGTVIHYGTIYIFMLFLTKLDKKIIIGVTGAGVISSFLGGYFVLKNSEKISGSYKIERIKIFLEGLFRDSYTKNSKVGYQVNQSLLAYGNGGFFGRSYGSGVQKYNYLPEIHSDFIMALFGEELGFIGVFIVIILFFTLYNIIIEIAISCKDSFGRYLALGIGGYIISQFLINIFVTLGLLPVFGIPMPVFSYGGSSMIAIISGIGIILNINKSMFDKK
ncbi:FtsW/RodA/SpoVE family cell cycle protein [Fusobacterium sp.]|uniref:FtsW/RodA/SpoVE family cell cycle protein n=1 Tax=Fusobacterium sp. TaxID=68766 RepID=UPI0026177454|nr:FtsW/RodA/SpoVE family cell cycle protein [Fusobacterium sp.]